MVYLLELPAKVLLRVLSFLPIRQILHLQLCSYNWCVFIQQHETYIYHAAAVLHCYSKPSESLDYLKQTIGDCCPQDVLSWKDFCRHNYLMEMRWTGKLPMRHGVVTSLGNGVHRFKIDEEENTIICTHSYAYGYRGGISVATLESNEILWSLRDDYVQTFTQCDFNKGFLVFDNNTSLHVWRRSRDAAADSLRGYPGPSLLQQEAYEKSLFTTLSIAQGYRGVFVPFTVITPPRRAWTFRLVYPTLLTASIQPAVAYLFDIQTGVLQHTIRFPRSLDELHITHLELSERHVFICAGENGLLIYPRDGASVSRMIRFEPRGLRSGASRMSVYEFKTTPSKFTQLSTPPVLGLKGLDVTRTIITTSSARSFWENVNIVCVSACGSHIACVGHKSYIYIIHDFADLLLNDSDPRLLGKHITVIQTKATITQMAYEHDRIAFHAMDVGLYVIPFASQNGTPPASLDTTWKNAKPHWPRVYQVITAVTEEWPFDVQLLRTCLQMTRSTLLYIPFEVASSETSRYSSEVLCLDFAHDPMTWPNHAPVVTRFESSIA